jgi:mediator of RNA polymerase II transcription subunit 6
MDAAWLQTYGLSRDNVLDYFYLSPFYDLTANNQTIRAQRVTSLYLLNLIGLEFMVETNPYEPTLFLIKKQYRKSSHHAEVLEVFYVMEGVVYQSPTFIDLLSTKYNKICLYLHQTFQISLEQSEHLNDGHSCLVHPSAARATRAVPSSYVKIREFPSLTSTLFDLEVMTSSFIDSTQTSNEN